MILQGKGIEYQEGGDYQWSGINISFMNRIWLFIYDVRALQKTEFTGFSSLVGR